MKPSLKLTLCAVLLSFAPNVVPADELVVFAASSLKDALEEISAEWREETGHTATVSLAGSSVLARQIQAGAPADLFISANTAWVDVLQEEGLVRQGSRRDLLTNALVIVAHDPKAEMLAFGSTPELKNQLDGEFLAVALVDAVPAGIYAKAALHSLGWWDGLAPQLAQTDNVRAALALVASGEAPLGIVYETDAIAEPRVTMIATFPPDAYPPIRYPMVITTQSTSPIVEEFYEYLLGPTAAAVFVRNGFGLAVQGG